MNQDQVKKALDRLEVSTEDFTVIFSGKASRKVNGLYKPATREIIIHNRNFENDDALMMTAIHELVHHIAITRKLVKARTSHPVAFWALFDSLLEIAIQKGIYHDPFDMDPELQSQGKKILKILAEQYALERKLGNELSTMEDLCTKKGARFEDYLDRHARIPRAEAKTARLASVAGPDRIPAPCPSPQVMNIVLTMHGVERFEAGQMAIEGKSIAQIRAAVRQKLVIDPRKDPAEDQAPDDLIRSLEKRIERMRSSKEALTHEIESLEVELDHLRRDCRLPCGTNGAVEPPPGLAAAEIAFTRMEAPDCLADKSDSHPTSRRIHRKQTWT